MDWIINLDKEILLALNGIHAPFFDYFMYAISGKEVWLLLYLTIIAVTINKYGWRHGGSVIIAIVLVIVFSDQITSGMMKPFFERFRPSRDPVLGDMVHIVNNYRGGKFGFASSHAANTFGLATITALLYKNRALSIFMFFWAFLVSYSRIYLGVHYPGDIITGATIGALVGVLFYQLYRKFILPKFRNYGKPLSSLLNSNFIIIVGTIVFLTLLLASKTMIK